MIWLTIAIDTAMNFQNYAGAPELVAFDIEMIFVKISHRHKISGAIAVAIECHLALVLQMCRHIYDKMIRCTCRLESLLQ